MNLESSSLIMKNKPEVINKNLVFAGQHINVYKDTLKNATGNTYSYEYIDHADACMIIPHEQQKYYLIQEYRYPVNRMIAQFPIETKKKDESSLTCAKRGLREELGLQANNWLLLGSFFVDPGISAQRCQIFSATGLKIIEKKINETEKIVTLTLNFNQVEKILAELNAEVWSIAAWSIFKNSTNLT